MRASLDRMAPVRPHSDKQVMLLGPSWLLGSTRQVHPSLPTKAPVGSAGHYACPQQMVCPTGSSPRIEPSRTWREWQQPAVARMAGCQAWRASFAPTIRQQVLIA
jgi:hypothetical protein